MKCITIIIKVFETYFFLCSQEEMERFPLHLVNEPTAVTNSNVRDVYNNIVLFTVMEDTYRRAPTEMHIFQCAGGPVSPVGCYSIYYTPKSDLSSIVICFMCTLFSPYRPRMWLMILSMPKLVPRLPRDTQVLVPGSRTVPTLVLVLEGLRHKHRDQVSLSKSVHFNVFFNIQAYTHGNVKKTLNNWKLLITSGGQCHT